MKKRIEHLLAECIDRVLVEGKGIDDCLARYPHEAAELEPLLRVALATARASAIEPRPEFRAAARYRLYQALSVREERPRRRFLPVGWQRRWVAVAAAVLALVLAAGSTVPASASSLPGDTLYPVKTATERVQLVFARSQEDKAELHLRFAQRRLEEVEKLVAARRELPPSVLAALSSETDQAADILSEKVGKKALVSRLAGLTSRQQAALTKVRSQVPPQALNALDKAIERSQHNHSRALEALKKAKSKGTPLWRNTSPAAPSQRSRR